MHSGDFLSKFMKHILDTPDHLRIHQTHLPNHIQNTIRFSPLEVLIVISCDHIVFQVSAQVLLDEVVESLELGIVDRAAREHGL
jgi:hypothetical protein